MPKMSLVDINDANLVAEGRYLAELTKITSSTKQTSEGTVPIETLTFKITDESSDYVGRVASRRCDLSAKFFWRYKLAIVALGGDPSWFAGEEFDTDWTHQLIGNSALIEIAQYERREGGKGYSVDTIYSADAGQETYGLSSVPSDIPY